MFTISSFFFFQKKNYCGFMIRQGDFFSPFSPFWFFALYPIQIFVFTFLYFFMASFELIYWCFFRSFDFFLLLLIIRCRDFFPQACSPPPFYFFGFFQIGYVLFSKVVFMSHFWVGYLPLKCSVAPFSNLFTSTC